MCMTIADGAQIIIGLGMLAVAFATYRFAQRLDTERKGVEKALQRHREEVIYQSKMNVLATLIATKHTNTLKTEYDTFINQAKDIVGELSA